MIPAVLQKIEYFVRKYSARNILNFELDIPVEIQYVVGNMFRFSLNQRGEQAPGGDASKVIAA